MLDPQQWTPEQLQQHSVDSRQLADFRQSTLPNGMRIIDAYNASGLHFTILPDRGLDIWTAHYKGIPLTWIAQGSPFPPDFGQTWLQQFNGGLLTTCGLSNVGPPETDEITGEQRDLHGRYSRLRANDVSISRADQTVALKGTVSEQRLFGERLRLQRTYTLSESQPSIQINDVVTNLGDQPVPLMLLYHINVGFPLVSASAELHTPHQMVYGRDPAAHGGIDHWQLYDAPDANYKEQVFFHQVKQNSEHHTEVLLQNGDFGFVVGWDAEAMPYFTQWKNARQGFYVSGLEPGNCIPMGQNAERKAGRLQMLAPGKHLATRCSLTIVDGAEGLQAARTRIDDLQAGGTPTTAALSDFASP